MRKLVVMFDIDDVLWHLVPKWIETINNRHGTNVQPDEVTDWEIEQFFPSLTRTQVFAPIIEDWFWDTLQPTEDAVKILSKIHKDGHKIKLITATDYRNVTVKVNKILSLFPVITWNDITITADKQSIRGDVLVDDRPKNLIGGDYHKILMSIPHNKAFDAKAHGIDRVNTLTEAYEIIKQLAKEPCKYYKTGNLGRLDMSICLKCKNCYDDDGGFYCSLKGNGEFKKM